MKKTIRIADLVSSLLSCDFHGCNQPSLGLDFASTCMFCADHMSLAYAPVRLHMREPQWSSDWEKLQAAGLCNDWVRISMTPIIFARRVECDIDAGTVLTTAPLVIGVGGGVWLVHAENGNAGYGAAHRYRLHGNDLVPALEDAEKQAAALARGEGTLEPKEKSYSGGKKA